MTIIKAIEAAFGEALGPDLILRAATCKPDILAEVEARRGEYSRVIHERAHNRLRPYVSSYAVEHLAWAHGKDWFDRGLFPGPEPESGQDWRAVENFVRSIKHHLLYCHELALEDIGDRVLLPFKRGLPSQRDRSRVQQWLTLLYEVQPLISEGILTFVDEGNLWSAWDQATRGGTGSWPPRALFNMGTMRAESIPAAELMHFEQSMSSAAVAIGISVAADMLYGPNRLDLYLGSETSVEVLRSALQCNARGGCVLQSVITGTVPHLDSLSMQDIVQIRRSEGVFADFREILEDAVMRSRIIGPAGTAGGPGADLAERMRAQCVKITEEVKRSSFLNLSQRGLLSVGVGAVAGMAMAQDWWGSLLGAGSVVVSKLAEDYEACRKGSSSRALLLRHCMVFGPGQAGGPRQHSAGGASRRG